MNVLYIILATDVQKLKRKSSILWIICIKLGCTQSAVNIMKDIQWDVCFIVRCILGWWSFSPIEKLQLQIGEELVGFKRVIRRRKQDVWFPQWICRAHCWVTSCIDHLRWSIGRCLPERLVLNIHWLTCGRQYDNVWILYRGIDTFCVIGYV